MKGQVKIMSNFTGTLTKLDLVNQSFGWIAYDPQDDDLNDEIYFMWDFRKNGPLPDEGTAVTFDRVRDEEKIEQSKAEGKNEIFYIAKNVAVTK
jgi:hypothetical protein